MHAVLTRRQTVPATGTPMTWATALDRFAHGVHRYHDRVEVIADRAVRHELQDAGAELDRALATARTARLRDVPAGDGAQAVRDLLRAGTLCAHAIEAALATAAARRAGDGDAATEALDRVRDLAGLVGEVVDGCVTRCQPHRRP